MLLVFLAVVGLSVWSWFALHNEVEATNMVVSIKGNDDVQIALPNRGSYPEDLHYNSGSVNNNYISREEFDRGERFKEQINFNISNAASDKEHDQTGAATTGRLNLFRDTTSDGSYFLIPTFEEATLQDGKKVNLEAKYNEALPANDILGDENKNNDDDYDYISLDFYLRTPSGNIDVGETSVLLSQSEADGSPLVSTKGTLEPSRMNNSPNQSYSADALVGAIRVSLTTARVQGHTPVGSNYQDTYYNAAGTGTTTALNEAKSLRFLWLPRPDIFLKTTDNYTSWEVFDNVNPVSSEYATKSYRHSFYARDPDTGKMAAKKGLVKTTYYDSDMQDMYDLSDSRMAAFTSDATTSPFFHVSKVDTSRLDDTVYAPTLGREENLVDDTYSEDGSTIEMLNKSGIQKVSDNNTEWNDLTDSDKTNYYVYKCTLNIWIEGDDAEARRVMKGGKFQLRLEFKG